MNYDYQELFLIYFIFHLGLPFSYITTAPEHNILRLSETLVSSTCQTSPRFVTILAVLKKAKVFNFMFLRYFRKNIMSNNLFFKDIVLLLLPFVIELAGILQCKSVEMPLHRTLHFEMGSL